MSTPPPITCRFAAVTDAAMLARMNHELIRDERHCNPMTLPELEERMRGFLRGEYRGVVIESDGECVGYALYRQEADHIFLRQFFIVEPQRRRGLGRAAMQWLRTHAWPDTKRVRLEVLIGNDSGRAFWQSLGLRDYCITMELDI